MYHSTKRSARNKFLIELALLMLVVVYRFNYQCNMTDLLLTRIVYIIVIRLLALGVRSNRKKNLLSFRTWPVLISCRSLASRWSTIISKKSKNTNIVPYRWKKSKYYLKTTDGKKFTGGVQWCHYSEWVFQYCQKVRAASTLARALTMSLVHAIFKIPSISVTMCFSKQSLEHCNKNFCITILDLES